MKEAIQLFISKFNQAIILILLVLTMIFAVGWFCQAWYTNSLAGQINTLKKEHIDYVKDQELAIAKGTAKAKIKEKQWSDQLLKAEQNYNAKLKQIQNDADSARDSASSLSKQLKIANERLPTASRETSDEYCATLGNVFERSIKEYSKMARYADEHAADARRLSEAWPSN